MSSERPTPDAPTTSSSSTSAPSSVTAWFRGRIPEAWFTAPADVRADRDEILVVGTVSEPDLADLDERAADMARAGRIKAHREATREHRMAIATEAEHLFGRKVSWGAQCGTRTELFTNAAIPVMTRLRLPERQVLDTLIEAGVARSRSEALAWCVRLVGRHQGDWIRDLRDAMAHVEQVRRAGPDVA